MTQSIDPALISPGRTRRDALGLIGAGAVMLGIGTAAAPAFAQGDDDVLTEALVLHDPDIPVSGNPDGNITIVEYFDFNCPYCRKLEPELRQVVHDDRKGTKKGAHSRMPFQNWRTSTSVTYCCACWQAICHCTACVADHCHDCYSCHQSPCACCDY